MSFHFEKGRSPILVSFPHSGTFVPREIQSRMTAAGQSLRDTDWYLPRLYQFIDEWNPSTIIAEFSRYVIDPNRPVDGSNLYPGQPTPELCPTRCFDGSPVYQEGEEPDQDEIDFRREMFWQPYHDKIRAELAAMEQEFGYAILFDAHSIRSHVPRLFDGQLPDINIGTNNGQACGPELENRIRTELESQSIATHVINGRFVGGFITRNYGQPKKNVHAVQLELSQSRYLDEASNEWNESVASETQTLLRDIFKSIAEWQPDIHSIEAIAPTRPSRTLRPNNSRTDISTSEIRSMDCEIAFCNFQLLTMHPDGEPYGLIPNGEIHVDRGLITYVGRPVPGRRAQQVVDGCGRFLSPGLIDCHTHLIFANSRASEWEQRLQGASYEEIAKQGGGILSTVRTTRLASREELFASASNRIENLIQQGVTTLEIKSGYGLDVFNELKMLEVATDLRDSFPIDIHRTFLGAHTVPSEFKQSPDAYVDLVCGDMLDQVDELCDSIDVFCESIGFSLAQTERVLKAGKSRGKLLKIHAEQLTNLGGAALAASLGAVSADHLEYLDEAGVQALVANQTVPVLLPGAYYFIHETQCPPVELLRKHKVPMAIASDTNPGSSPAMNLLLMANMACTLFRLTPEEALAGLTRNAALALGLGATHGTLEVGKQADFAIWDIESPAELAYFIGNNPCRESYKGGRKIFG